MKTLPDQSEVIAECNRLKFRAECLRAQAAATGVVIAPPALSGDILADMTTLQAHLAELEAKLPPDAPAASNLAPAKAAPVAAAPAPAIQSKKMTLTEKVLAAQGCKTLAESKAKWELENGIAKPVETAPGPMTQRILNARGVKKLSALAPAPLD